MKTIFRILGTAAAVAATGAAIYALDKILNQKDPLHVEAVEFPEEAETDPAEAEKAAESYAEGEAKAETEAAPAQESTPEQIHIPTPLPDWSEERPIHEDGAPNPNPVEAGPAVAPKDENGKFDPTRIAESSDFANWEEQGCQG